MIATDRPISSPVLVGRAQEVESLERVLRTVRQGRGQVVLLAGEAGVGKSRLVAELRRRAAEHNFTILAGHCFERDVVFPYAPLIDALRTFFAPQPAGAVAELLGVLAAELVKLLPELGLVLPKLHPTPALDPEAEKRRLFEALLQFFARLTQVPCAAPLLLILEDLHWSDETSLDFLHLLARRIAGCPTLLLATYRHEEVSTPLRQLLVQLERGRLAQEVVLTALNRNNVAALLQAILELGRPVRPEFLAAIYALTEGNPFFIEEVLKSLIAAGDVFKTEAGWERKAMQELRIPRSVQDAVQRRTQQLSAEARQLLTVAAVAGRRFDFALLQQVGGQEEHQLLALMKELVAAQLVREERADQFAFRHALTRQAVYSELLGRERQALHRTIGATIERSDAGALDARVADLAYHFHEAGEWAKALDYAQRAGKKAQALYAPRAAVEHFTQALAAAKHLAQKPLLAPLYRSRGSAYETLGEFEQAHADLEMALELARAVGDRPAEWQMLLDLGQLWASRDYAQTGDYFRQALELARGLDNPAALAHCLNRVGNWHLNAEHPHEALRYHREALTIFETLNDQRGVAATLDLLGMVCRLGADLVQSRGYYERAVALFRALDDRQGLVAGLVGRMGSGTDHTIETVALATVTFAECEPDGELAVSTAREIHWRTGEAFAVQYLAVCLYAQGKYARALTLMQSSLALATEMEHRQWMTAAHRNSGRLYLDVLAFPVARQHFEDALALAKAIGSAFWMRILTAEVGLLLVLQHELVQAAVFLNAVLDSAVPMQTTAQRMLWRARAELALASGEPSLALQIADRLLDSALYVEQRGQGIIPLLAKVRGEALTALRRWPEAEMALQAARERATTQGARPLLWRIAVSLGTLYQAQGRRAEAEHAFAAARQVIEELAATLPDPALRDNFLRQATVLIPQLKPSSSLQAAKQTYGGLTRREREVALLIAQGKSNRTIAEALVLGERTVEGYVANILAKLGFASRTQIAVWAIEKGLTSDDKLLG